MADNNEKRCPLCGKQRNEGEEFCKDCREIADTAYPEELLAKVEPDEILEDESESVGGVELQQEEISQMRKSSKKSSTIIFISLIFLVVAIGFGSYFFIEHKNAEATEMAYWEKCLDENTPLAYSKYLVQYPDGKYSEQAHVSILELREKEREEWDNLRKSRDVEALFAFLKDHPDTPYGREIRYSIDSLSWIATSKANTKEAYLAYIDNVKLGHCSGEYVDLAQQKYDYLSQLKILEGEELKEIGKVFSDFFKALSVVDDKDIQKYTDTILVKFYDSNNQKNNLIADSIKISFKKAKIKNISYILVMDSLEVIKDNKDIYFAVIPVKTETTFTDKKKKTESNGYKLSIELNKYKLIQSVEKGRIIRE